MVTVRAWADAAFREQVRRAADRVLADDVRAGATDLWRVGLSTNALGLGEGLWNIWGRITDEFTHPDGDPVEGERLALEAATELRAALGNKDRERAYCDRWIYEKLDIT
jgi:hypothetical protein